MSRFGNLEFDPDPGQRTIPVPRTQVTDEHRCLVEAEAAFARAEFESALRWFGRALEFNPRALLAWTGQVRSLIELGQNHDAKIWADKALEIFPQAAELLAAKSVSLARLGQADVALAFSDAALDQPGELAYVWLARGDVLLARHEKQVDFCFDRALQLAPGDWLIRWLAARIRAYWRQFAAALKVAQEAAALAPDRFVVWMTCGECQSALGLTQAAATSFHQTLALQPGYRPAEERLNQLRGMTLWSRFWKRLRPG